MFSRFFLSPKLAPKQPLWRILYDQYNISSHCTASKCLPFNQPVDQELVKGVTATLQAHERLRHLTNKLHDKTHVELFEIKTECNHILESLKQLKSSIEGSQFIFNPISLPCDQLTDLQSTISTLSLPLDTTSKTILADKVQSLFKGQVKRVLYSCVISCPWYNHIASKCDSLNGDSQRSDVLYVVYVSNDEHFFSIASQHDKDKYDVFNEFPLFACEIRQFLSRLQQSNVKAIEALSCPSESVVINSSDWNQFTTLIEPSSLMNHNFISRCVGQAINEVMTRKDSLENHGKRRWKSHSPLILRDDVALNKCCDSLRLLSYAQAAINREPLSSCYSVGQNDEELEIIKLLTDTEANLTESRSKLAEYILNMKKKVTDKQNNIPKENFEWSSELSKWTAKTRTEGVNYSFLSQCDSDPHRNFLDSHNLSFLHSRDLVMVAKGGSHMYNLATPTSDIDYIVIYKQPTETIINTYKNDKGYFDNRGISEITAYECRLYCEMLMKGAVNMFELLYADDLHYSTPLWEQLIRQRDRLISEKVIEQYIGLVEANMKHIAAERHIDTPSKEQKLFYQIYHKLLSLESFSQGGPPVVWCPSESEEREFIMKIRQGSLQGDNGMDRNSLYLEAEQRLEKIQFRLRQRKEMFYELTDHHTLQSWLLSVRGWTQSIKHN